MILGLAAQLTIIFEARRGLLLIFREDLIRDLVAFFDLAPGCLGGLCLVVGNLRVGVFHDLGPLRLADLPLIGLGLPLPQFLDLALLIGPCFPQVG